MDDISIGIAKRYGDIIKACAAGSPLDKTVQDEAGRAVNCLKEIVKSLKRPETSPGFHSKCAAQCCKYVELVDATHADYAEGLTGKATLWTSPEGRMHAYKLFRGERKEADISALRNLDDETEKALQPVSGPAPARKGFFSKLIGK
jgi:hypothetical protein